MLMRRAPWCAAVWLLATGLWQTAVALTIYVAPDGQPANNGLSQTQLAGARGPLPTLADALAAMRKARASKQAPETDRIVLLPGRYELAQTLVLTDQDSGSSPEFPLVIEAEVPGSVWLSGSRQLTGFKPAPAQAYLTLATDLPRGFHMLWINGERATRARSPKLGTYYSGGATVATPVAGDRFFKPQHANNIDNTRRLVLPAAAQQELQRVQKQGPLNGLVLLSMHAWTSSAQRVSAFDAESGIASVTPDSLWTFFKFGPDQRFALENLPGFLDEPGEWWASDAGEVRYWPLPGQAASGLRADIPQLERLLDLQGSPGRPVENIHFKGLRFAYSAAWVAPFIDGQAAMPAPSALVMSYARSIVIEQCAFEHLGGYAVSIKKGSRRNVIKASVFRDLGAGGIRVGETAMPKEDIDVVEHNHIENNLIEDAGRVFPGAIGIWVGQSGGNTIEHNELRRLNYTGISVGWTWGFGGSKARDNLIQYNYLHDIGQGVLSDLGAIYTLGISNGTRISHNRIEDIRSFRTSGSSAWGIYLDEGSSHIVVENNMVNRTTGGGLHLHYGNDNLVRNNVFAGSTAAQVRRSRKADSRLRLEGNLLIADGAPLYYGEWADRDVVSKSNILVTHTPADLYRKQNLQGLNAEGFEEGSVVLGSKEVSCTPTACKVAEPIAKRTGFKAFSVQGAGLAAGTTLLGDAPFGGAK